MLGFAIHNIVQYLIRQRRCSILTLLLFYVFTVTAVLLRIYTALYVVPLSRNNNYAADYLPQVSKLMIGLLQFWTMTELAIRVKQCVRALQLT